MSFEDWKRESAQIFDPEGSGYDYMTAKQYGITPDETGHWPSREPTTGMLLKGRGHETWNKTLAGEEAAGHEVYEQGGRYFSRPKSDGYAAWQEENAAERYAETGRWGEPIEPGQGSYSHRVFGAVERGVANVGRGIAHLPLRISEMTERISKTSVPGPSYVPSGFKRKPNKVADTLKAVQSWYADVLEGADESIQKIRDRHPEWAAEPPENFLDLLSSPDKLALAVIETTPLLVSAGLATAAGMPQVGYAIIFAVEGEEAREQALADGQSEEVADTAYLMYGSVATIIEGMQLKGLINIGKESYRAVLKRTAGKLVGKKLLPKIIKRSITEAIQEQAQGSWQEATAYILYGKVPPGGVIGFLDRRAQEGLIAATMTGGVSITGSAYGKVKGMSEKNKATIERTQIIAEAIAVSDTYTDMQKDAMFYTLDQIAKGALKDVIPTEVPSAEQLDAAETLATRQEELLKESVQQQQEAYEELLEQAQDGDEVAAQKIQEMEVGGPLTDEQQKRYTELLDKVQEGDEEAAQQIQEMTTDEKIAEDSLPTFEVLFEAMLKGDEVARSAIADGKYKKADEAVKQLEPEAEEKKVELDIINQYLLQHDASKGAVPAREEAYLKTRDEDFAKQVNAGEHAMDQKPSALFPEDLESAQAAIAMGEKLGYHPDDIAAYLQRNYVDQKWRDQTPEERTLWGKDRISLLPDRGATRVDSMILASDEKLRNISTIRTHTLAKLLGIEEKDRRQIQLNLIGQKSLKNASLEDVKIVEDYFAAKAQEHGLTAATGPILAETIKANTTQKSVKDSTGLKAVAWKRMLLTPGRIARTFMAQSKRIERLLEALDGFTEGPVYNSVWKVVRTQSVNSRVSKNGRINKFKEALVDIMAPELKTEEGLAAATEEIQKEQAKEGKKAKKLTKKAIRELVGDSLWARYITSGRQVALEATDTDPELSLNASERIGIYLAMKNENSMEHLRFGNLADFSNPDLAMMAVLDAMTSQEKQIADWILADLETNFQRADQAAIIGLNRKLTQHDNYFPIRVLDIGDFQQEDFLTELIGDKPKKAPTKVEVPEVKERKRGQQQALNIDSFEVYLNHITRIEQFIHMAPVAKSVGKILNTPKFQQAVNNVTWGHGSEILKRWLKNSIKGHSMEMSPGLLTKAALWSRRKGVLFFLTGNVASVARQFISFFDGVATHPMTLVYTMQHMAQSIDPRYYKTLEERMKKLSPEMVTRSFERYLANIKHQAQAAGVLTGREQWSEKALSWQRWADRRTVVLIWNGLYDSACNSEAIQKQFELDGSDEAAVEYANKMVGRTQPMGDIEHLPDFFTRGPIEKLLSTFQNQINNRWNFWAHDIYGMRKAGKISNSMVMYRVLFSHVLPALMFGAISRGGLPKDWKDVMFDELIYLVGPISLLGRIITDALLGFSGGRTGVEDALTANVGKALQAVVKGEPKKAMIPALKAVGGLTGRIPNQAIRTGQGIKALATGETDDLRRLIYSDWSLTHYGWPESAEEKAEREEKETWMKR